MANSHDKCERNLRCKSSEKTNIEDNDRESPKEVQQNWFERTLRISKAIIESRVGYFNEKKLK